MIIGIQITLKGTVFMRELVRLDTDFCPCGLTMYKRTLSKLEENVYFWHCRCGSTKKVKCCSVDYFKYLKEVLEDGN